MIKYNLYRAEDLRQFMIRFFCKLNVSPEDAAVAADVLLSADLRGVESHGIIRLNTYYGSRLKKGLIDPKSPLTVIKETATTLALDGGNGLGQVVSKQAMQRCIAKARQSGVSMVTVRNSNHYGIAGYYAMMALPEDMIGISFTNSQPLVAPTYSSAPLIGTNPIAVAVPAGKERPYVLDMATSIVPIGKITVYDKAGKDIPAGWGINRLGEVTETPSEVLNGGALQPLGGIDLMAGYKGYGLSLMVDIFSGVLSGAAFGPEVGHPSDPKGAANVGHFFAAVSIDAFRPIIDFKAAMDRYIEELKNAPKAVGQNRVYIHGEKEFERSERYRTNGVPLLANVASGLVEIGSDVGVPFDCEQIGTVMREPGGG
jgi:LDH2 family malate/lactate/ureidoglycolate dehydrogenase